MKFFSDPSSIGRCILDFNDLLVLLCRFEQYVDYALDVPMYFAYRNNKYIDCTGMTFRVSIYPLQLCNLAVSSLFAVLVRLKLQTDL